MFNTSHTFVVASCLAVFGMIMGPADAAIITPTATGTATGSLFVNVAGGFDAQPATAPVVGDTGNTLSDGGGTQPNLSGNNRTGFMDFGLDYADFSITATYELLKQFGSNPTWTPLYFWSTDTILDGSDVAAPNFGFNSPTSASNSTQQWIARYAGPAVTPSARYLLISTPDTGDGGNRSLEWVFVGEVVPEPTSLALMGLGGLLMLCRSRKADGARA